jgi:hypothetical protein
MRGFISALALCGKAYKITGIFCSTTRLEAVCETIRIKQFLSFSAFRLPSSFPYTLIKRSLYSYVTRFQRLLWPAPTTKPKNLNIYHTTHMHVSSDYGIPREQALFACLPVQQDGKDHLECFTYGPTKMASVGY